MSDADRLVQCFAAVFPTLDEAEIRRASTNSVGGWDSLATINLVAVVEEEFALQVPPSDLEQLVSFELILDYLQHNCLQSASPVP
jgi:acyl carrier protein